MRLLPSMNIPDIADCYILSPRSSKNMTEGLDCLVCYYTIFKHVIYRISILYAKNKNKSKLNPQINNEQSMP